ncbi:hypothetical protein [Streptomyces albidoflavus]|uniref:hypothetical protein n=1 Tax=Streptomyces albidoflavus TaxID=1886 RepID=UPI0033E9636E
MTGDAPEPTADTLFAPDMNVPLPTPPTRLRVARCCNGCGNRLARPATDEEVAAVIAGDAPPDVRPECPVCSRDAA